MYPVSQAYKDAIMQPSRQFRGRLLIPKLTMNFTRNSIAYKQDGTQVAANQPRFEQGKFGQAIMVEEGTTNLVSNPSFESGMWPELWNPSNGTATLVTGWNGSGNAARITITKEDNIFGIVSARNMSLSEGVKYTISFRARAIRDNSPVTYMYLMSSSVGNSVLPTINLGTTWQRYTITYTIPAGKTASDYGLMIAIDSRHSAVYANDWIEVDDVQLEAKPYATSFVDGTRAAETLTIPTAGVLNDRGPWTIECWAKTNHAGGSHRMPFAAWNKFYVDLNPSDKLQFSWVDANNVQQSVIATNALNNPTGRHYWAFTWDGVTARIYVDGVKAIEVATDLPKPLPAYLTVGWGAGGYYWNGLIDDLRISNRAKSDEEILAAYREVA